MYIKKTIAILSVIVLLLSLVGCANNATPNDTINTLFDALKKYDMETIKTVVSEFPNADGCNITYDPFSDTPYVLLYQKAYTNLEYQINSIKETGDTTATATLTVTHPDLKTAYTSALYTSMAMIFSDEKLFNSIIEDEDAEISNYVPNQMQNMVTTGKVETIETEFTLQLTKSENGWKITTDEQLKNLISSNLYQIASGTENIFATEE